MDTDLVIYLDNKFKAVHDEIHPLSNRVSKIEQYIKDKNDESDYSHKKFNKVGVSIASIAAVVVTIAILI